jgi:predicted ATP-grasp superfamily ATP-dependent carboligase
MDKHAHVLIVAASGRALAASARRGGYRPLVVDYFGDQDTLASVDAHHRLADGLSLGMRLDEVMGAIGKVSARRAPIGVVCGTGFEDRPDVLAAIAQRWPLIGNGPEAIALIKDPMQFADLCRATGIPHPDISLERPTDPDGWLMKRHGGAGGQHIAVHGASGGAIPGRYFQRRMSGASVSALILAHGGHAIVLGFSAQWPSPTPAQPFRFGGAVTPADIAPAMVDQLVAAIRRVVAAVPIVGLNSADFLIDGEQAWLLEINPRPGATLDIFEPEHGSLFALHVAACRGALSAKPARSTRAKASAIVYADRDFRVPALDWPAWTADRPHAGSSINAGEPVCTVFADAATPDEARRLVARRGEKILSSMCARAA